MKVFFGHTMTQSSAYYRMIGYAEEMRKQKLLSYECSPYDPEKYSNSNKFFEDMCNTPKGQKAVEIQLDLLNRKSKVKVWIFQKFATCHGLAIIKACHDRFNKPVITEIDDYMFALNSDNPNYGMYDADSLFVKIGRHQLSDSDALVVSTEYLKDLYKSINDNIFVVPNAIDFKIWDKLTRKKYKSFVNIGWSGGSAHDKDLKIIIPVIKEILKKHKKVKFTLLGDGDVILRAFPNEKRVKVIRKWIPINKYPAYKASLGFDIELAPLTDTTFNRAKSNLRWLEASALKVPVVASDVGPYKDIVGRKASTTEEWVAHLDELIGDKRKRKIEGKKAYRAVKENFNIEQVSKDYAKIIKKIQRGYQERNGK